MLLLVGLAVCCAASQASAGQGFRATAPATYHRAEELVCCGSAGSIQDDPGDPGPRPEHCCGKGWGLHCCLRGFCCLDDGVVPVAAYPPERLPTPAPPVLQQARTMASLRVRGGDEFWRWKNWAEWLNLAVVILIVALVCAVLACCWRRKRRDEALRHQKRRLLRLGDDLYTYGAVRGGSSPGQVGIGTDGRASDMSENAGSAKKSVKSYTARAHGGSASPVTFTQF